MTSLTPNKSRLQGFRAKIAGGSVGGLATALALQQWGAEVELFERTKSDRPARGGAITLRKEARASLKRWGVQLELGVPLTDRYQNLFGFPGRRRPWAGVGMKHGSLVRSLEDASTAKITYGAQVEEVHPSASRPSLVVEGGTRVEADLVVVADGANSGLYPQLWGGPQPAYAGYVAWRGQVRMSSLPEGIRRQFENTLWEYASPGKPPFAAFPIEINGEEWLSWTLCEDVPEAMLPQYFPQEYVESGLMPPGKAPAATVAHIKELANRGGFSQPAVPREIGLIVQLSETFFGRAVQDLPFGAEPGPMNFEGVAVVADGHLPLRPTSAQSSALAVADAEMLAECLAIHWAGDGVAKALSEYDQIRRPLKTQAAQRVRDLDTRAGLGMSQRTMTFLNTGMGDPLGAPMDNSGLNQLITGALMQAVAGTMLNSTAQLMRDVRLPDWASASRPTSLGTAAMRSPTETPWFDDTPSAVRPRGDRLRSVLGEAQERRRNRLGMIRNTAPLERATEPDDDGRVQFGPDLDDADFVPSRFSARQDTSWLWSEGPSWSEPPVEIAEGIPIRFPFGTPPPVEERESLEIEPLGLEPRGLSLSD